MQNYFTQEQVDNEFWTTQDLVQAINVLSNRITELEAEVLQLSQSANPR